MSKFEQALLNPTSIYQLPVEVVQDNSLTREQKIQILHRWEYDARELQIAEEENMPELAEEKGSMLSRVLDALYSLDAGPNHSSHTL
jgi:hypothetical protein